MLFFSIINRYLQWKDDTYHSQSPSESTKFQVSFHSRKDATLNHHQFGTACQHVVLQPLFVAASLLDHQIKLMQTLICSGWGNPYVIDHNILDLARPRCCNLERCVGWSLKVTHLFLFRVGPSQLNFCSICRPQVWWLDWSFPSCAVWMCCVPFQLVNSAWMPEITCNLLLKEGGAMLHCCCVKLPLKWNLEITCRHCHHMLLPLMFRNITQS